jgi:hypothetical protein
MQSFPCRRGFAAAVGFSPEFLGGINPIPLAKFNKPTV